jgi:excisionase family DNA binding protein
MSHRAKRLYLFAKPDTPPPPMIVPRLMRIPEAARYLSATTWQVETLLREKTIPSFVLGKRRVVDRFELDRFIEERNAKAKNEQVQVNASSG